MLFIQSSVSAQVWPTTFLLFCYPFSYPHKSQRFNDSARMNRSDESTTYVRTYGIRKTSRMPSEMPCTLAAVNKQSLLLLAGINLLRAKQEAAGTCVIAGDPEIGSQSYHNLRLHMPALSWTTISPLVDESIQCRNFRYTQTASVLLFWFTNRTLSGPRNVIRPPFLIRKKIVRPFRIGQFQC